MSDTVRTGSNSVRLKSVALPVEHGGWAFLLEPVLLGFLLAPSLTGLWLGIAALGVFLLYQPLKVVLKDYRKGKRYPRTQWAERFTIGYGLVALLGLILAVLSTSTPFWLMILAAAPFACLQIISGLNNQSRTVLSEIAGAIALSAVAPAIVIAGAWQPVSAFALWAVPVIRAVTSILYIRSRLRLERGEAISALPVMAVHSLGIVILLILVIASLLPWPVIIGGAILWGRAFMGLSTMRRSRPAKILGFMEMGYGLLVIVITVAGYKL